MATVVGALLPGIAAIIAAIRASDAKEASRRTEAAVETTRTELKAAIAAINMNVITNSYTVHQPAGTVVSTNVETSGSGA
jgi:hypothetical protein